MPKKTFEEEYGMTRKQFNEMPASMQSQVEARVHNERLRDRDAGRGRILRHIQENPIFTKACELAGIPATRRQASKFNMRRGLAYAHVHTAKRAASGTR